MNVYAEIGHNNPPDPLDEALAPYSDHIEEAQGWLDGEPVENQEQMRVVDALLKEIKAAKKAAGEIEKENCVPLHSAWKEEKARFKPTLDDLDRITKGLASIVSGYKTKLAAEKAEAERQAQVAAAMARREAEEAAKKAQVGDIEEQRAADVKMQEARAATKDSQLAKRNAGEIKGLRTITKYEITDHKAALHDIAKSDRNALTAFIEDYVRRNHKARNIEGVHVWQEKEAF